MFLNNNFDFDYLDFKTSDFSYIGERLKEIREELVELEAEKFDISMRKSSFTQTNLGAYLGINNDTIVNIEKGSISYNTLKLIMLYQSFGYNPLWVLNKENQFISKKNINQSLNTKEDIKQEYIEMKNNIDKALQDFKKNL